MNTIRDKLTAALLIACAVLLGAAGWFTYVLTRKALLAEVDARLRYQALTIIQGITQESDRDKPLGRDLDVDFSDRLLTAFNKGGTEFYQVWRVDGLSEERSDSLGTNNLSRVAGTMERPRVVNITLPNGKSGRAMGIEFVPPSPGKNRRSHDAQFTATVVVAGDLEPTQAVLSKLRRTLLGVGLLAFAAVLFGVPWLLRRAFRPVDRLSAEAAEIDAARLNHRFSVTGLPAELQPIASRLNELLSRLEISFQRQRRFSADVAHELRTPVAELRSLAEVALRWCPSAEESRRNLQDVLTIAQRMEGRVNTLLAIARSEAGSRETMVEPVTFELAPFIATIWTSFAAKAAEKKIAPTFEIATNLSIRSDRELLETIVENLLSNAVDYTPRDGKMAVRFSAEGETGTLFVINDTNQLTADDLPRMFDRFWRKDQSRSDSQHSGLGLSLVQAAADMLGLVVRAELNEKSRVTISVSGFKLARASSHSRVTETPLSSETAALIEK